MIIKSYEIEKINTNKDCLVLFYGKNDGLKNEAIEILNKNKNNIKLQEEKKRVQQEYILNKLRFMQDYRKNQVNHIK